MDKMKIRTFNNISDVIYDRLEEGFYEFTQGDDYDAAIVRSQNMHDMELPEGLLAIARSGIGTDNIPVERCSEQGTVVFNAPGANANAVKELVICSMILAGRDVIGSADWIAAQNAAGAGADVAKQMEKVKKQFAGREIAGKTLGVIGLGAIGAMVANAAAALDMNVIGYDPYLKVETALMLSRDVKVIKSREELFRQADFVTLHIHLNENTANSISEKELELMKDGSVVLNFGRGGLVDEDAIIAALGSGRLSRYVTDFPSEKLIACDRVIAFPHLGGSTPEAEVNCARIAAKELDNFLRYGNIKNSVNFPDCDIYFDGGCRLCIVNKNITNMIGQITAVLAAKGLNIEHMLNRSRGNWAYTIIDVNRIPDEEDVRAIEAIDGIVRVRVITE